MPVVRICGQRNARKAYEEQWDEEALKAMGIKSGKSVTLISSRD